MKKRVISMLLCMAMAVSITACGSKEETAATSSAASTTAESTAEEAEATVADEDLTEAYDGTPLLDKEDYDIDECVKVGEYKNLEVTKTVKEVTEGDIVMRIMNTTGQSGEELKDKDATVQIGDTAVIEYEGKKDGVPFDGGTSTEPYDLVIGSGSFIPGFEDGLIGMKAGETRDLDLTFPENYGSAELAGQDVVFTVKLNSIKRLVIDDAWVKEHASSDFKNAEEYLAQTREVLEKENEVEAKSQLYSDVWETARGNSTYIAYPKSLYLEVKQGVASQYESYATESGYDSVDLFLEAMGLSKDSYEKEIGEYSCRMVQERLFIDAMAKAENITEDSEEYKAATEEILENTGAPTTEDLVNSWGQESYDSEVYYIAIANKILSYAKVTEA